MPRLFITIPFFLFLFNQRSVAQMQPSIKGKFISSVDDQQLAGVKLVMFNLQDSTIMSYRTTKSDGIFYVENLGSGSSVVIVAVYEGFNHYQQVLKFKPDEAIDLGNIVLQYEMLKRAALN